MSTSYKFQGWLGDGPDCVNGKLQWKEFEPKKWEETDVDIEISHCGICGSDVHTMRSGWGKTNYPCCVGHEIVGKAVRVGSKAEKGIKLGDRVGVGAQSGSCLLPSCESCSAGLEQHCFNRNINTYDSAYPEDGYISKGGYGDYWRGHSHFVIPIPSAIPSAAAAPMLCGGITMYRPLKLHGCGTERAKRVGIVGLGGLGHFGILYAKALGAEAVVAISRSSAKRDDALKIGATEFIATDDEDDWASKHAMSLDLIVSTVSHPHMPLESYLQLLRINGTFVQVGAPEDRLPAFNAFALIAKGAKIAGSAIGAPREIEEMLALTVEKGVVPWVRERPMRETNRAVVEMVGGEARYRFVLVNERVAAK